MTSTLIAATAEPSERIPPGSTRSSTASAADYRAAGLLALIGVALSVIGSVLNQVIPDVDVFAAMDTSSTAERARLLDLVANDQSPLVAGFAVWMIAFPCIALASVFLARVGRQSPLTELVRHMAVASIGAMLVFLSAFIAFVVAIAPAHVAGEDVDTLAHAIGYTATTVDWTVTAIVIGLAPIGAIIAGRNIWAPRWLQGLAAITMVVTVVELVGLATDHRAIAFPLVPVGMLLLGCAGVCALRRSRS